MTLSKPRLFTFFLCFSILFSCTKDPKSDVPLNDEDNIVINDGDIELTSIVENQIIDEPLTFGVKIINPAIVVKSIEVLLGNESIFSVTDTKEFEVSFNPDDFPSGENIFKILIIDGEGNEKIKEIAVNIHRKLLEINIPEGFLDSASYTDFYFFASALDGSLLASKQVTGPSNFFLTTPIDIDVDTEYMITYAARSTSETFSGNYLVTVQNISRNSFDIFSPQAPLRFSSSTRKEYPTTGISQDDIINIGTILYNNGYGFGFYSENQILSLDLIEMANNKGISTNLYAVVRNLSKNEYAYTWLERGNIPEDFVFDAASLTSEGVETRTFDASYSDGNADGRHGRLSIDGYLSETDYQNGLNHGIWNRDHGIDEMFSNINSISYFFNTTFTKYRHSFQWEDYFTQREGEPLDSYDIPTWSFDYTLTDRTIDIIKNGEGHTVGRIDVTNINDEDMVDGKRTIYNWKVVFDSKTDQIKLPDLPEGMLEWEFGKVYEAEDVVIEKVDLASYQDLSTYDQYLDAIVKENISPLKASPKMEAKYKANRDRYWIIEPDYLFY